MKRLAAFAILAALIISLAGCAAESRDFSSITVYYPYESSVQNRSRSIGYETRTVLNADSLKAAVEALSANPSNSSMRAVFPEEVKILSFNAEKSTVNLVMSDTYAEMPLGAKAVARSCVAMTLCGIAGIESVSIFVGDIPDIKNLRAQDILTENTKLNPYEARIKLYFSKGTKLASEYREITLAKEHPAAHYVMQELLRGPQGGELSAAIPSGTSLLSLTVSGGICTVNLSPEFLNNKSNSEQAGELAVYSIVNTLTAISGIAKVQILVNGEKLVSYLNVNIYYPLSARDDLILK